MEIRTRSPGDQLKRNKRKEFTKRGVKFWNLPPWEAQEAAGKRVKNRLDIRRFTDIHKGTGTDTPPDTSNPMSVDAGPE